MGSKKVLTVLLAAFLTALHGGLAAQTLGQFGGAGPAPEGEGNVFMLAGNDALRAGFSTRFNLTHSSDFGVQLGVDRACEESFFGGGIDVKVVLLEKSERLPLNLALDAAFGALNGSAADRFIFDFGILASGAVRLGSGSDIEPYLSFVVNIEQIDRKNDPPLEEGCLCSSDGDETSSCSIVRGGVILPVSKGSQVIVEGSLGGRSLIGAAFNVVF
jgi:hypothetical protein